jgi:hypothetical protein
VASGVEDKENDTHTRCGKPSDGKSTPDYTPHLFWDGFLGLPRDNHTLETRRNLCLPEILSQTFHRKKVCDEICTSTYLTTNSNFGSRFLPHTNAIVELKNCDTRNSFKRAFYSLCE